MGRARPPASRAAGRRRAAAAGRAPRAPAPTAARGDARAPHLVTGPEDRGAATAPPTHLFGEGRPALLGGADRHDVGAGPAQCREPPSTRWPSTLASEPVRAPSRTRAATKTPRGRSRAHTRGHRRGRRATVDEPASGCAARPQPRATLRWTPPRAEGGSPDRGHTVANQPRSASASAPPSSSREAAAATDTRPRRSPSRGARPTAPSGRDRRLGRCRPCRLLHRTAKSGEPVTTTAPTTRTTSPPRRTMAMPIAAGASTIPGPAKERESRQSRQSPPPRALGDAGRVHQAEAGPETAARPRMNSVPDQEKPGAVVSSLMNTRATTPQTRPRPAPQTRPRSKALTRRPGDRPGGHRRCRWVVGLQRVDDDGACARQRHERHGCRRGRRTVLDADVEPHLGVLADLGRGDPGEDVGVVVAEGGGAVAGDARAGVQVRPERLAVGRGVDPLDAQHAVAAVGRGDDLEGRRGPVEGSGRGRLQVGHRPGGTDHRTLVAGVRRRGQGEKCHDGREW